MWRALGITARFPQGEETCGCQPWLVWTIWVLPGLLPPTASGMACLSQALLFAF